MLFSSIPFLYYFLPAVMLVYFLSPRAMGRLLSRSYPAGKDSGSTAQTEPAFA